MVGEWVGGLGGWWVFWWVGVWVDYIVLMIQCSKSKHHPQMTTTHSIRPPTHLPPHPHTPTHPHTHPPTALQLYYYLFPDRDFIEL